MPLHKKNFLQVDIGEKSKGKTLEGANNPVTDGDMKSHIAMFYGLKKTFEGLNIISEEHNSAKVDMVSNHGRPQGVGGRRLHFPWYQKVPLRAKSEDEFYDW